MKIFDLFKGKKENIALKSDLKKEVNNLAQYLENERLEGSLDEIGNLLVVIDDSDSSYLESISNNVKEYLVGLRKHAITSNDDFVKNKIQLLINNLSSKSNIDALDNTSSTEEKAKEGEVLLQGIFKSQLDVVETCNRKLKRIIDNKDVFLDNERLYGEKKDEFIKISREKKSALQKCSRVKKQLDLMRTSLNNIDLARFEQLMTPYTQISKDLAKAMDLEGLKSARDDFDNTVEESKDLEAEMDKLFDMNEDNVNFEFEQAIEDSFAVDEFRKMNGDNNSVLKDSGRRK